MTLQEWLKTKIVDEDAHIVRVARIKCTDGFALSVQASEFHYCEPRENRAEKYTQVEVGFPSQKPELIMKYAESPEKPTETVYCYVPIELVEQLIELHGGITGEDDRR